MPYYDFQCKRCEKIETVEYKIDTAPDIKGCIYCEGSARRIISRTSFVLKGDGWPGQDLKRGNNDKK